MRNYRTDTQGKIVGVLIYQGVCPGAFLSLSTHVTLTLVKPGAAMEARGCHLDLAGLRRSLQ